MSRHGLNMDAAGGHMQGILQYGAGGGLYRSLGFTRRSAAEVVRGVRGAAPIPLRARDVRHRRLVGLHDSWTVRQRHDKISVQMAVAVGLGGAPASADERGEGGVKRAHPGSERRWICR